MARHIHIYLPARVRDTAPAPAKHPPAAVSELVERLMQAIADRSGKKTTDAGFDESKVKRDEGGKFSAQQHSAAAQEHKQAEQHHYNQAVSTSGSESLAHSAAATAHRGAASYHKLAAAQLGAGNTSAERTANMAHEASTNAIGKTPGGAKSASPFAAAVAATNKKQIGAAYMQAQVRPDGSLDANWDVTFRRDTREGAFQEHRADIDRANAHMEKLAKEHGGTYKPYTLADAKRDDARAEGNNGSAYSEYEQSLGGQLTIPAPKQAEPKGNPGSVPKDAIHPALAAVTKPGMPVPGSKESPKGPINEVTGQPIQKPAPAASDKPTKSTAKGKAGAHELLSSGHPFSVDELMAATGVTNRTTMLTALSDLKNPKYAGSKGALNIVKRADGSYHVQKSDAPAPAAKTQSKNPGGFNTSQPDPKAAKPAPKIPDVVGLLNGGTSDPKATPKRIPWKSARGEGEQYELVPHPEHVPSDLGVGRTPVMSKRFQVLHNGEVIGEVANHHGYKEKRTPGSRIVNSRTSHEQWRTTLHAGHHAETWGNPPQPKTNSHTQYGNQTKAYALESLALQHGYALKKKK